MAGVSETIQVGDAKAAHEPAISQHLRDGLILGQTGGRFAADAAGLTELERDRNPQWPRARRQ